MKLITLQTRFYHLSLQQICLRFAMFSHSVPRQLQLILDVPYMGLRTNISVCLIAFQVVKGDNTSCASPLTTFIFASGFI